MRIPEPENYFDKLSGLNHHRDGLANGENEIDTQLWLMS